MQWFRSIRQWGAALGLFALLLQSGLAFGHIHPEDLLGGASAGVADQIAGKAQPAGDDQDRHSPGAPHDDCPICAVMHLAGISVQPVPPSLVVPTHFATTSFVASDTYYIALSRRLPFQTRAPPLV
jgi:Protein of unknown function (DUF2946)